MDESWGVEINAKARRPLDCGQALTKLMETKKKLLWFFAKVLLCMIQGSLTT